MTSHHTSQRFCVQLEDHHSNMISAINKLRKNNAMVDVTLAVDGHLLKAHKLVLAAWSPYFQVCIIIAHPGFSYYRCTQLIPSCLFPLWRWNISAYRRQVIPTYGLFLVRNFTKKTRKGNNFLRHNTRVVKFGYTVLWWTSPLAMFTN